MRYLALCGLLVAAVFSYQNCHNQSFVENGEESRKKQAGESSGTWSAVRFSADTSESWYEIDLDSGEIYAVDPDGEPTDPNPVTRYCLTESQANGLAETLQNARVCEPVEPIDPNTMCTMIYIFPYAQLIDGSAEDVSPLVLGESQNGCMTPRDLCDPEKATRLRTLLVEVRQNFTNQRCD